MRETLPALLAEIAGITDIGTALAVAGAKGGVVAMISAHLSEENWLVKAVGMDKARIISEHFTSGRARVKVFIPLGPTNGSYKAEQRRRAELLAKASSEGLSAPHIARSIGITDRSVHRFRSRLRAAKNTKQGSLF
jgi:hypothetical protein